MRIQTRSAVARIQPFDAVEETTIAGALAWIDSGADLWRGDSHHLPSPHLVAYFPLVDVRQRRVLLVDHRKAGLWLPPGGHVEPGEHPRDTALREAIEELGIEAEFLSPDPLFVSSATTVGATHRHVDVSLWYAFRAEATMPFAFDGSEFERVRWFAFDALPPDRTDPHLQRFVQKLQQSIARPELA